MMLLKLFQRLSLKFSSGNQSMKLKLWDASMNWKEANRNLPQELLKLKRLLRTLIQRLLHQRNLSLEWKLNMKSCEWKAKADDLMAELDACNSECRNFNAERFRVKAALDESGEQLDIVRRENKNLADEVKDLLDQLGDGGRSIHELDKQRRRLEVEKEELQAALEEAEGSLEAEENKVLRAQLELGQVKQEIDRRIAEK